MIQGSSRTFASPYCLNLSRVQWLALVKPDDPVSRGPIMSQRYSMLAINSEFLSISSRTARVTALTSTLGSAAVLGEVALGFAFSLATGG